LKAFTAMSSPWIWLAFAVVTLPYFAAIVIRVAVSLLARQRLVEFDGANSRERLYQALSQHAIDLEWLAGLNFQPLGVFHMGDILDPYVVTWKQAYDRTYIALNMQKTKCRSIEVWTAFESGGLTTSNARSLHSWPPPSGEWIQTYAADDVKVLWRQHRSALDFLAERLGQVPSSRELAWADEAAQRIRKVTSHLFSFWCWHYRVVYWHFTRPRRLHSLSVQEQYSSVRHRADVR
jgi:hypothetical protein